MNCYKCDTLLEKDWNYCPNCKRKIKKSKLNDEELISTDEAGKCRKCCFELNDNWNFCPMCGNAVDFSNVKNNLIVSTDENINEQNVVNDKENKCPNCGALVDGTQPFCAECGSAVEAVLGELSENVGEGNPALLLILAYISPIVGLFLLPMGWFLLVLCLIISLISILYAKNNYPDSKVVKIAYYIYVALAELIIGAVITIYLTCLDWLSR